MKKIGVLIVCRHPMFGEGITHLVGDEVEIVGIVPASGEARKLVQQYRPHVIVVEHEEETLREADLAPLLWEEAERLKVIYVTLAGTEMIVHNRYRVTNVTQEDLLRAVLNTYSYSVTFEASE